MNGLPDTPSYEDDETLSKLQQALDDASGIDMRAAIESAIEDRKAELRQNARSVQHAD
ncbi:hypothetical protein [Halosimplex sp. J119]